METILNQLAEIKNELGNPFPYSDIYKILEDFEKEFLALSDDEDFLIGDFNSYLMNIAGTLSYVLGGKINKIPQGQIEMLRESFFDFYNQYKFLENKIEDYNEFFQEYKIFDQARKLLITLFSQ
ncbi:YxiJ family protein [Bacillus sp. EB01]|uniref:YxiJ family protein n=1 Tax=Bacillus sp. EB01 TaxID=1347086 RepID=UPI0005C4FE78|nr:YxiJ family protein [Bacillus sp. EB01]